MAGQSVLFGEKRDLPSEPLDTLHRYFERAVSADIRAAEHGLRFGDSRRCYAEVNECANAVARILCRRVCERQTGLEKDAVVVVDVEPCDTLIVVLLAIVKTGAAYLPVDSHSAINRVRYTLHEAAPLCIVVDGKSEFKRDTDTVWSSFLLLDLTELVAAAVAGDVSTTNLAPGEMLRPPELLCVIYTSGSTGRPKGVRLDHTTAMNRLCWQWTDLPFGDDEVGCFKTSLLFVDSIVEIFSCLLKLIPLVIAPKGTTTNPERFMELLEEEQVTRLVMVPSLLRSLLFCLSVSGGDRRLPKLRLWLSNSETLQPSLLAKFFAVFADGRRFANLYGSSETMADVTYEMFSSADDAEAKSVDGKLSIGVPMCNSNMYVLGEDLELLPRGEVGELCVSGRNVAAGYVAGEGASASDSDFVPNPFAGTTEDQYDVLYRTGDFGRVVKDRLIYEGRKDMQVKIRGQRVNINEIETVINDCAGVDKTVVLCHRFSEISNVIVAYYTTLSGERQTRIESELTEASRKCLPVYMRPKLLHLGEIPLQPHTGKVDRVILRRIYEKAFNRQSSQELAVLDEKGHKALNIIALNLNMPTSAISRKASFFELGGNSVSMVATIVQLRTHGLHIAIDEFSGARTVQDIIDHVCKCAKRIGHAPLHTTSRYEVRRLVDVNHSGAIVDVLAESFVAKEPLDVLLGVTRCEMMLFARSLYTEASKGDLSLVVLERESGRVVGGDFLFDYFAGVSVQHHESMAPILCLLRRFEEPVKHQLMNTCRGRLMFNFCLCVDKDLPPAEQVEICHVIEANVLKVAASSGFIGVITNNTNPVTQDICEHFYDYRLLSRFLVRDFDFNGRKVFAHAPEDYYIKMMIKYLENA